MATIDNIPDDGKPAMFEKDSKFFQDQLKAEIFKLQIRRDAKRMVDDAERSTANDAFDGIPKMVYEPLPEASPELIPGLIPESGTAAIVGETNVGKTTLACEIASSLLTGELLWGSIKPNRTINRVAYILGEHTTETLQGLYHRLQLPHTGDFRIIGPEQLHPYKAIVIGGVAQQIAIDRLIRWTEGAGLIVFDPLAGFVQGMAAENDNSSMRTLIDAMSLIATKNNACCLILSHMGKPMLGEDGAEIRRSSYATRGATAIEDSLTHIYYVKRSLAVKQQQDGNERFDLSVRKYKGTPISEIHRLQRDPITVRNTLIGAKSAKGTYPTADERKELQERLNRTLMNNSGFTYDTALKIVADGAGMTEETLRRWLT